MAKKRSKTTKTAAPKASPQAEPVEERSSFLPGEDEPKELESLEFKVEVDEDSELLESAAGIQLSVKRGDDRRLEVSLTVPPLETWTERGVWLMSGSAPEHIAGTIAAAIERAAHTVAHDATVQYARRMNEEAESKERFTKRA